MGGEVPSAHPTAVEGESGATHANDTVEDTVLGGETDSVESNTGYVNGQQGE